MPSVLLTAASGSPFPIVSGNPWSGTRITGGVQLRLHPNASGNAYITLSGGGTVTSGSFLFSGLGYMDGYLMAPGNERFVDKAFCGASGSISIYATCDGAASGQARLFYEIL